ncbi:MAG: adenine phosphoribosyltransferase [Clostridia bacterium]|nr:adenine phosphoribosyltransferase [Clostridia bacterium]
MMDVKDYIRTIPDFPQKGVMFRDVTTVLQDARGLELAVDSLAGLLDGVEFDVLVGIESRGFLFGTPIAYKLKKPFVPVRKKGKLPFDTVEQEYSLEYGSAVIEMHADAIKPGQRAVIIDDLIATGGTVRAAAKLIERLGGSVAKAIFLIELPALAGRENLSEYAVDSVVQFDGE